MRVLRWLGTGASVLLLVLGAGSARADDGGAPDATVTIDTAHAYYTLPKYWLGGKMTAYGADIATGTFQSSPAPMTEDGKTFMQLMLESGLDSVSQSMVFQGTPANPNLEFAAVRTLQLAMVKGTTENGVSYPGGAACSPHMLMGVDTDPVPTTTPPESQPQNRAPASAEGSRENLKAWIDQYVADVGLDHIMSVEFYNEPATENDQQYTKDGPAWYSYVDFPSNPSADVQAAHFAACGHRVVDDYLRAAYPKLLTLGSSYAEGAGNGAYQATEIKEFIAGYDGWPWADDPNTHHMAGLSSHSYGSALTNGVPGAPGGEPQSIFNAIFFPEASTPAKPKITSGKSGYRAFQNQVRATLDANDGQATKQFMSEWWAYDGGTATADWWHIAFSDVLGVIVAAQNADTWKQAGIMLHAYNAYPISGDGATCSGGSDFYFGVATSPARLWRSPRYFAARDLLAPFGGRDGNKNLVKMETTSPQAPGGTADNAVNAIQAVASLSDKGDDLRILVANLDTVSSHRVKLDFGRKAKGAIHGKRLVAGLAMDTPLSDLGAIAFDDDKKTSFADTLGAEEAALYVVPLSAVSPDAGTGASSGGGSSDGGASAGGGTPGAGGGGASLGDTSSGCGCDMTASGVSPIVLLVLGPLGLGLARRRRRRGAPRV